MLVGLATLDYNQGNTGVDDDAMDVPREDVDLSDDEAIVEDDESEFSCPDGIFAPAAGPDDILPWEPPEGMPVVPLRDRIKIQRRCAELDIALGLEEPEPPRPESDFLHDLTTLEEAYADLERGRCPPSPRNPDEVRVGEGLIAKTGSTQADLVFMLK
jgi:hypothetical protein